MKNNLPKILIISVAVLVVLNLGLMAFIFLKKEPEERKLKAEPRPPRELFNRFLVRELDFDQQQAREFREISRDHIRDHLGFTRSIRDEKLKMHKALVENDSARVNMQLEAIQQIMSEREREVVNYTRDLIQICNDEQKTKLLTILNEASSEEMHPRRRLRRGKRGN